VWYTFTDVSEEHAASIFRVRPINFILGFLLQVERKIKSSLHTPYVYVEGAEIRSFLSSALVKVNGQPHAPPDLFPGKEPQGTMVRRLSGKHTRSGQFGKEKIILAPVGIFKPDRPTHKWFNNSFI
jgi:hypothetical protein